VTSPEAPGERPASVFDPGLQHERNALAWERTAIASMVAGVLFGRYAAQELHLVFAVIGVLQLFVGAALLVWSGMHYEELHGRLRRNQSPVHPAAARVVGLATVVFSGSGLILAIVIAFDA